MNLRGELPPEPTVTELRVLRLRAKGMTTQQTADELGISINTAKYHVRNAYQRLGVFGEGHASNAILRAMNKLGWVRVPGDPA